MTNWFKQRGGRGSFQTDEPVTVTLAISQGLSSASGLSPFNACPRSYFLSSHHPLLVLAILSLSLTSHDSRNANPCVGESRRHLPLFSTCFNPWMFLLILLLFPFLTFFIRKTLNTSCCRFLTNLIGLSVVSYVNVSAKYPLKGATMAQTKMIMVYLYNNCFFLDPSTNDILYLCISMKEVVVTWHLNKRKSDEKILIRNILYVRYRICTDTKSVLYL